MSTILATDMTKNTIFSLFGPIAQRLEQTTHNRLVGGSNPSRPTTSQKPILKNDLSIMSEKMPNKFIAQEEPILKAKSERKNAK